MDLYKKFGSKQKIKHESFKIAQKSKLTALGHFLPKEKIHVYSEVHMKAFYIINYVLLYLFGVFWPFIDN
jgi:hypothetical protein